jgi:hypothetical protein
MTLPSCPASDYVAAVICLTKPAKVDQKCDTQPPYLWQLLRVAAAVLGWGQWSASQSLTCTFGTRAPSFAKQASSQSLSISVQGINSGCTHPARCTPAANQHIETNVDRPGHAYIAYNAPTRNNV